LTGFRVLRFWGFVFLGFMGRARKGREGKMRLGWNPTQKNVRQLNTDLVLSLGLVP